MFAGLCRHLNCYQDAFLKGKHGHPPTNQFFLRLHIRVWDSFCLVGYRESSKKKVTGLYAVGENDWAHGPGHQFSSGDPAELG